MSNQKTIIKPPFTCADARMKGYDYYQNSPVVLDNIAKLQKGTDVFGTDIGDIDLFTLEFGCEIWYFVSKNERDNIYEKILQKFNVLDLKPLT